MVRRGGDRMKSLTYQKENHAGKLMQELLEIKELQPIETDEGFQAVFSMKHSENNIYLRVPDEVSEAEIQATIDAHDPTPPVVVPEPSTDEILLFALSEIERLEQKVTEMEGEAE